MTDDLLPSLTEITTARDIDAPDGVLPPAVKVPSYPTMVTAASIWRSSRHRGMSYRSRAVPSTDLPIASAYLRFDYRQVVWCKACRNQRELSFRSLVEDGKGDVLVAHLIFRCTNCGSRPTDAAVSGSHLTSKQ